MTRDERKALFGAEVPLTFAGLRAKVDRVDPSIALAYLRRLIGWHLEGRPAAKFHVVEDHLLEDGWRNTVHVVDGTIAVCGQSLFQQLPNLGSVPPAAFANSRDWRAVENTAAQMEGV